MESRWSEGLEKKRGKFGPGNWLTPVLAHSEEENSGFDLATLHKLTWPSSRCYDDLSAKVRRLELFSIHKCEIWAFIGTLALGSTNRGLDFICNWRVTVQVVNTEVMILFTHWETNQNKN